MNLDTEDESDVYLLRCLARHVINEAKQETDDFGNGWDIASGIGKKYLLEKAFMNRWEKRHGKEMADILWWFIRCEMRNGTTTIPTKSD